MIALPSGSQLAVRSSPTLNVMRAGEPGANGVAVPWSAGEKALVWSQARTAIAIHTGEAARRSGLIT
jgi:hypothetical protein